jgi:predicted  nucleic acid-binding Zn-ribbon protein
MSDNRTAEQLQKEVRELRELKDILEAKTERHLALQQQVKELKEEMMDCRNALEREKQYLVKVGTEDAARIKQLQEEVERLKDSIEDLTILREAAHKGCEIRETRIAVLEEAIERVKDLCANQLGSFMSVQEVLSALSGKESNG